MKIFVTGDNHIGLKYASHEEKEKLIAERTNAFSRMVAKANNEECELFAITGDLFDRTSGIPQKSVKAVVDALGDFKGIVAVIPGNHDFYDENVQIWKDFKTCLKEKDNIVLLNQYKPYTFDEINAVIYPAFCDKLNSEEGENKIGWIKNEDNPGDEMFKIGMAHGTVEGEACDKEGKYFVMTREELYETPVDVWLIGHTHVPFPRNLTEEFEATDEKVFNAGAHVQTDVSNNTEGLCFILDIDKDKKIRAKKFVSGGIRFYRKNVTVTAGKMEAELVDATSNFGDNSVVELTISGAVTQKEFDNRYEIIESVLERFMEHDYDSDGLMQLITKEFIEEQFPIEKSFAREFLNDLLSDPKEAYLAFDLITKAKEDKI